MVFSNIGETGTSCYWFKLKSLFVKSMIDALKSLFVKRMIDALFLSTYSLSVLFVLINCTVPLIFHTIGR